MMEEIDFLDSEIAPKPPPPKRNPYSDSGNTTTATNATTTATAPLRLPRTSAKRTFLKDTLQSQIPTTEQLHKTRQQAGNVLKGLGNQLGKLNLGKLIDKMEQDQGLADSLEQLNSRMKEEVQRQEVRREAEELTLRVILDHLTEFLEEHPLGTYEEWIQDLHPENANQGQLLTDIQQIDERFYVQESDHRRLWNEAIETQQKANKNGESYQHRLVKARTQIWGKAPGTPKTESGYKDSKQEHQTIDFLSALDPDPFAAAAPPTDNGMEEIDFFAPAPNTDAAAAETKSNKDNDPFQDLIQL